MIAAHLFMSSRIALFPFGAYISDMAWSAVSIGLNQIKSVLPVLVF